MKIETFSFYLENLLPGVAILLSLLVLLPPPHTNVQNNLIISQLLKSEVALIIGFITISYLLGLLSAVISRFFVDMLSELFPRPLILRQLSHKTYAQLKASLVTLPDMNGNWRKAWNLAYRTSLRFVLLNSSDEVIKEIFRRREQGRLVRNLFFPLVLGSVALTQWFQITNGWVIALVVIFVSVFSIFAYAYSEYSTFAEAILHVPDPSAVKADKVNDTQKWSVKKLVSLITGRPRIEKMITSHNARNAQL